MARNLTIAPRQFEILKFEILKFEILKFEILKSKKYANR